MVAEKRMRMIYMIEKMQKNEKYSTKLGLANKSYLETKENLRREK